MKIQLSPRQIAFIAGNTVIASSLVTLPQALIDLALQNTWLVPLPIFAYIVILVSISLFGSKKVGSLEGFFAANNKGWKQKMAAFFFLIFILHVLMRDLRVLSGFVESTLLPLTPLFMVTILILICSFYIAWLGIEVIARFTELHFMIFMGVLLFVPLSLIDQIQLENFEPILGLDVIPSILQSAFVGLAWFGEIIIVFLLLSMIKPMKHAKRSIILGGGIGLLMFSLLLFSEIGVLGAEIIRYSIYPTYSLVQQIRLTEFLDRLDLVLVTLYFPTIFSKIALFLYGLHRSWSLLLGKSTKLTMVPLTLIAGIVSIVVFANKAEKYDFQIYSWATLGVLLQLLIAFSLVLMIRDVKKSKGGDEDNGSTGSSVS